MEVVQRLTDQGSRTVLVGGAVRNAFLSRPIPDWDIATSLTPPRVAALFERVVRAGEKHGTIMVLTAIGAVEVTTFRGEGLYLDGRRPSHVTFHDDLRADLSRRDFTINAMAADLGAGQVIDPFGGRADLERRRVRCVGDPRDRFAEDGLRPLRAVRLPFAS
jgi:tRNA nucleotidyltransferase (CCA-adding enzyme)